MQHENIEAFGKLATQVAHDIRTPLTVIGLFLQGLETRIVDPDYIQLRKAAVKACARIDAMANELLDYRRTTDVRCEPIDLAVIVSSVCEELGPLGAKQKTRVIYKGPQKQRYYGDRQKLERVVQNLVHNAIQALQGVKVGRVTVELSPGSDQMRLTIRDNGPGIPLEHVDKLFSKGFTTKKTGNGLGMIYCTQVIQAHGGRIQARNLDEGGAEFMITLPIPLSL